MVSSVNHPSVTFDLRTALAESELEYNDQHLSRSVYVRFPISKSGMSMKWQKNLDGMNYSNT